MHKDFFEFKLEQPINQEIKELILYAPKNVHRPLMGKLDCMLMNGMMRFQDTQAGADSSPPERSEDSDNIFSTIESDQLIAMLKAVPSDNYDFFTIFCAAFKDLILAPEICKMKTDNKRFPEGYFDKMSYRDGDRLIGEYLKNFFTFSASS